MILKTYTYKENEETISFQSSLWFLYTLGVKEGLKGYNYNTRSFEIKYVSFQNVHYFQVTKQLSNMIWILVKLCLSTSITLIKLVLWFQIFIFPNLSFHKNSPNVSLIYESLHISEDKNIYLVLLGWMKLNYNHTCMHARTCTHTHTHTYIRCD